MLISDTTTVPIKIQFQAKSIMKNIEIKTVCSSIGGISFHSINLILYKLGCITGSRHNNINYRNVGAK